MTTPQKPWPTDAVIVIASRQSKQDWDQTPRTTLQKCRDCGEHVVVDDSSLVSAIKHPSRNDRTVAFLCIECAVNYKRPEEIIDMRTEQRQ